MFGKIFNVFSTERAKRVPPPKATTPEPPPSEPATSITQVTAENVTNGVVIPQPERPMHKGMPVPLYPERGLAAPAVSPDLLLESQKDLIDKLHQVSSFSRADFDIYLLPAIYNYAAFVHLLPASETQHHCGQGGLFRHGLEVAANAALACEGKVFAFDHWASERAELVPRWRMCAILGGLMHDMGKPILDVGAVDATGINIWVPHATSLYQWLVDNNLSEYYIHWRPGSRHKRHEAFNALAFYSIVPQHTRSWLSERGGQEAMDSMVMALLGSTDVNNPLNALIKAADSKSVSKDIKDSRARLAASGLGGVSAQAMRMMKAIHDLIQDGTWTVNKLGTSPIWVTTEGTFGIIDVVIKGAIDVLREKGETSLPVDARTALMMLDDFGYLHPNPHSGNVYLTWEVRISTTDRGQPIDFTAHVIKFAREDVLPRDLILPERAVAVVLDRDGQPISPGGIVATVPKAAPEQAAAGAATAVKTSPALAAADKRQPRKQADKADSAPPLDDDPRDADADAYDQSRQGAGDAGLPPGRFAHHSSEDEYDAPPPREDLLEDTAPPQKLRDRSKELDPRDEMMRQAREEINRKWPPDSPAAAAAYFRTQGTEGTVVLTLSDRVVKGELQEDRDVWEQHGRVHFKFPESFAGLGIDEAEVREMLEKKGWTERDPRSPSSATVKLQTSGGRNVTTLRFNDDISQVIVMLFPARAAQNVPASTPHRRNLPLGPYLDEDVAAAIKDMGTANPDDSPLIRPGFHQFVLAALDEQGRDLPTLSDADIRGFIHAFHKQHRLPNHTWLFYHVTRGGNAWAMKPQAARNQQLVYNEQYDLERDLQTRQELTSR